MPARFFHSGAVHFLAVIDQRCGKVLFEFIKRGVCSLEIGRVLFGALAELVSMHVSERSYSHSEYDGCEPFVFFHGKFTWRTFFGSAIIKTDLWTGASKIPC